MQITIEVRRNRPSVTQGSATVYINGEEIVTYGDEIELLKDGDVWYGENIGGWASRKSDAAFICGALNPKISYYQTEKIKADMLQAIKKACEAGGRIFTR